MTRPTRDDRFRQVAVVGPGDATSAQEETALALGAALARVGAVVVTGGLGGVMAAACQGATQVGGLTVGLLPGTDAAAANPWVRVVIPTGLGEARNALVVRAASVLVAVGGGWGTLSEIALALRTGVPVVSLDSWAPVPLDDTGPDSVPHPQDMARTQNMPSGPVCRVDSVDSAVMAVRKLLARPD